MLQEYNQVLWCTVARIAFNCQRETDFSSIMNGVATTERARPIFFCAMNSISKGTPFRLPDSCAIGLSKDSDCPAITLANAAILRGDKIFYRIGNQLVHFDTLFDSLDRLQPSPAAVVATFAFGNCEIFPTTPSVSQLAYLRALFMHRRPQEHFSFLTEHESVDMDSNESRKKLAIFKVQYTKLMATAFINVYGSSIAADDRVVLPNSPSVDSGEAWPSIRKAVWGVAHLKSVANCMPETDDSRLNYRRPLLALRYWMRCNKSTWTRAEIGGLDGR